MDIQSSRIVQPSLALFEFWSRLMVLARTVAERELNSELLEVAVFVSSRRAAGKEE
jgi:hypothetical protein